MEINNLLEKHKNEYVILIDMSWVLYRSYYAFTYLTNDEGMPTGQYYGLCKTLMQILTSYPNNLVLLVDDGNPVERKQLNESYKGNREHGIHFSDKKHIVDCLIQLLPNVYRVYHPTLEADDLLFSISKIKDYNNSYIIYSSDKDLYQSIDSTTVVSNSMEKGQFNLIGRFSDQYINNFQDLEPFQIPYYRAVLGDASDNLPNIRPRFPSKVAYYFAKHFVSKDENNDIVISLPKRLEFMSDKNYENLIEIYKSPVFINNLKLMKLERKEDIPLVDKTKSTSDVQDMLLHLQLREYTKWLENYGIHN